MKVEDHLQGLIFSGVSIPNQSPFYQDVRQAVNSNNRYKRFVFLYKNQRFNTFQKKYGMTPYTYLDDNLLFDGKLLNDFVIKHLPDEDYGSEKNWYFKHDPRGNNPFWELRLNPINGCYNLRYFTGKEKEFRGCAFCHRMYDMPRIGEIRRAVKADQIFDDIFAQYEHSVIPLIEKVLLVTGNARTAEELFEIIESIYYNYLDTYGFQGTFSVVTSQIKTKNDILRLSQISDRIFDYPIECFTRRESILGPEKGVPMDQVLETLRLAREQFKFIRVNYIVGLDSLEVMKAWFTRLVDENIVDDVVATIMTPFSPAMENLRISECNSVSFILKAQKVLEDLGLWTKRLGVEKSIFRADRLADFDAQDLFTL